MAEGDVNDDEIKQSGLQYLVGKDLSWANFLLLRHNQISDIQHNEIFCPPVEFHHMRLRL